MNPTDAALMDLIARLVQVDRELALISISEETDPQKVAKAMDEIAKGDAERDKDKPDHADNAIRPLQESVEEDLRLLPPCSEYSNSPAVQTAGLLFCYECNQPEKNAAATRTDLNPGKCG